MLARDYVVHQQLGQTRRSHGCLLRAGTEMLRALASLCSSCEQRQPRSLPAVMRLESWYVLDTSSWSTEETPGGDTGPAVDENGPMAVLRSCDMLLGCVMTLTTFVLDALVLIVAWGHVLLAPYTKVEESFNLHAVHDVIVYGVGPSVISKVFHPPPAARLVIHVLTLIVQYDHVIFPGAVPRTFVGSVILAWISTPVIHLGVALNMVHSKLDVQILGEPVLHSL